MRDVLATIITEVTNELGFSIDNMNVINSNRPDLCEYQCDDVFKLAKLYHKSPLEIGTSIVDKINNRPDFNDYFNKVSFIPPGFINISISDKFINNYLSLMNNQPKFNLKMPIKKETYFMDYGGPNVAKPLHVGHMRTAIVGEAIKRIIMYFGHTVISDVHLGDYGLQIGQVIYGLKQENIDVSNITIADLDRIYPMMSARCKENEEIKNMCAAITKDLQDGNQEYQAYFRKICEVSITDIKSIYNYLDVHFDLWLGESDAYPYIPKVEKLLQDKKLLEKSENALVVYVAKNDDRVAIPPLLFKKANGAYMYPATDLGSIYQRIEDYNPDHILYVVDNRQALHFEQVFRTCELSGLIDRSKLEHLGYGTVNGTDGKPYKTRSGDTPKLQHLFEQTKEIFVNQKDNNEKMDAADIDKIVNSILKFADLQNSRERDYIFDINKFSEVVGKTGPYILYTYLRINKIIENFDFRVNNLTDNIYNNYDRDLRIKLLDLEYFLNLSFKERKPNYLTDYLYELCVCTNAFYQNNHIMNLDDIGKRNDWLYVLNLTNRVIKEMLKLLAIDIPKEM
ncbi:MAG: arginine--tRNA ligase [Bacilli bacterium]